MKIFRKIIPIMILSLLSSPVLLLQSCGDQPPYGSSVTVEALGSISYDPNDPASDPTNATKTQNYRVTVLDEDGFPMNGIKVDVFGTIDSNSVIDFFGSAPPPATSFSEKTGKWGFLDFAVVAHVYTPLILNAPTTVTATGSTSGGGITIPQSSTQTICYGVSVIDANTPTPQETGISSPVCAAITNSTI